MTSPTRWTWVWVNSGSWWWTGRPGVLQFMGLQRVGHNWATEMNWTELKSHKNPNINAPSTSMCLGLIIGVRTIPAVELGNSLFCPRNLNISFNPQSFFSPHCIKLLYQGLHQVTWIDAPGLCHNPSSPHSQRLDLIWRSWDWQTHVHAHTKGGAGPGISPPTFHPILFLLSQAPKEPAHTFTSLSHSGKEHACLFQLGMSL